MFIGEHPYKLLGRLGHALALAWRDSAKDSLELQLFSEEPLYNDFELLLFADSLTYLCSQLGANNKLVEQVLNGKSPEERAASGRGVRGSRVPGGSAHPAGRELLAEPGECRTHDIAIGDCAVFYKAPDVGFEHVCSREFTELA